MNNDIRKLVDDNWDEIKELIIEKVEVEQKPKPKTIWDLETKDSEEYYCIEAKGSIDECYFDSTYDEYVREAGNAFLTREEAEFELERRKIEAVMRKYSKPYEAGENNYCILYFHDLKTVDVNCCSVTDYGMLYFKAEEIAEKVIDEIGEDRLKKYWFRITE